MVNRRLGLLVACALAVPATALANGRPPQTMGLHFRPGHESDILLAATFGAMFSDDDGATWHWMCETAVGYGGTYDPDYAMSAGGAVFATTFDGLQINRDGCTFSTFPAFGATFAGAVTESPDGAIFAAMNFVGDATAVPPLPADYKIYKTINDGVSFDAGVTVGTGGETWTSLEVAPSDPQRVYLTGYRLDANQAKIRLFYRSTNGGASFAPMGIGTFEVSDRSDLQVAAISPSDPDRMLMRVTWWNPSGVIGDAFYLSTNGGTGWTKVLETNDNARGAVFRANGDAVVGTSRSGVYLSTTQGASFALLPEPQPDVYCLHERTNGELWACTNNYDTAPQDYAVMKTTDLTTWTGVMRIQDDIVGPVDCPIGTLQQDCCTVHTPACPFMTTPEWCFLRDQLGITANPIQCDQPDASMVGGEAPPKSTGCCDAGSRPGGAGLLALVVGWVLGRRRRRA